MEVLDIADELGVIPLGVNTRRIINNIDDYCETRNRSFYLLGYYFRIKEHAIDEQMRKM